MEKLKSPELKAVVTYKEENITGGIPIFKVAGEDQAEEIAQKLGKILQCVVHDLENGLYVIVKH